MQVICRTNIQTSPGDIYVISPRAILSHVVISLQQVQPRNLYVFLLSQTGRGLGSEKYDYTPPASIGVAEAFPFS